MEPGSWRELGLFNWAAASLGGLATGAGEPLRLFTTLGRHRPLFRAWLAYSAALMPFGRLPRRESELVILRVAWRTGSRYELAHHRRLGRRVGLSELEVERACAGEVGELCPREQALIRATDELLVEVGLSDETWSALAAHLGELEIIELCLLVGHYRGLASTLNALRVAPEAGLSTPPSAGAEQDLVGDVPHRPAHALDRGPRDPAPLVALAELEPHGELEREQGRVDDE